MLVLKGYTLLVCGRGARNFSKACLVSSRRRSLNSVTQFVTVETISRAAWVDFNNFDFSFRHNSLFDFV
jgi:hypothetical protein